MTRSTARVTVLVLCGLALNGCAFLQKVNEKTGMKINSPTDQIPGAAECKRMSATEIAWEEERDVGGALALAMAQKGGGFLIEPKAGAARPNKSATDQLNLAVAQVGFTVAAYSARPDIAWTFGVLDSDVPNAFSSPGGYVLITRGLLRQVDNESQLAAIIAHEIGHVSLRHALHVYRTSKVAQCYADKARSNTIGTVKVKSPTGGGSGNNGTLFNGDELSKKAFAAVIDPTIDLIISKGYAQGDELEADDVATDLLVMAGYDPREFVKLLNKLPNEKGVYPNHPSAKDRVARVGERLSSSWSGFGYQSNPAVTLDARIAAALKTPVTN